MSEKDVIDIDKDQVIRMKCNGLKERTGYGRRKEGENISMAGRSSGKSRIYVLENSDAAD